MCSTLGGREGASAATGGDLVLAAECAYDGYALMTYFVRCEYSPYW